MPQPADYQGPQPEKIRQMFSQVASGYDKANSVLSLGIHHLWRKKLIRWIKPFPGAKVLDCATGTGDLAIEFKKAVGPRGSVIGTDFCEEMLKPAPTKAHKKGLNIHFQKEDVMNLSFADESFDFCSISFGIRNVESPRKALAEMARVTKKGGTVVILEFGQVSLPIFAPIYNFYSRAVLPRLGGWITGQGEAYQYLQKSSSQFPCGSHFLQWMKETGYLENCQSLSLSGGIAYIYKAQRK